jgi:oxalate decarboxylase/phosphoglucose isomerase-like protein (cupin superfamily)
MSVQHLFSFADNAYARITAHGGRGTILFARILDRVPGSGCNWLDMSILPPGASIGLHAHGLEDEEIYIVISGRGRMIVDDETFMVGAGDVVLNQPGGTHALENTGDEDLRIVVIDIRHDPRQ